MMSQNRQQDVRIFLLPMDGLEQAENMYFLFTQSQVAEIIGFLPIQKIPFSERHMLGIIPYRDQLLPVINVLDLCAPAVRPERHQYKQLMIIRTGAVAPNTGEPLKIAIMANSAIRTLKLSTQAMTNSFHQQPLPSWLQASEQLRGFFQWQDSYVAMLDVDQLVSGPIEPDSRGLEQ